MYLPVDIHFHFGSICVDPVTNCKEVLSFKREILHKHSAKGWKWLIEGKGVAMETVNWRAVRFRVRFVQFITATIGEDDKQRFVYLESSDRAGSNGWKALVQSKLLYYFWKKLHQSVN